MYDMLSNVGFKFLYVIWLYDYALSYIDCAILFVVSHHCKWSFPFGFSKFVVDLCVLRILIEKYWDSPIFMGFLGRYDEKKIIKTN